MNYLYYDSELAYPTDKFQYSPSEHYPEYPFSNDGLSKEPNRVYAAIREMFSSMHLDEANYGTPKWNPLGRWIKPGLKIVIKPNFVMHKNGSRYPDDLDSLVTHPSVIRCILDYCYIALKKSGSIIVGDAPVKDCDFLHLMMKRNYQCIADFYGKRGIDIKFIDFRDPAEEGERYKSSGTGVLVDLGKLSCFYNCIHDETKLRVPNYDYRKVIKHHTGDTQEYLINSDVLDADVVINIPKPKTHRKNGYTGALKNFVGIVYNKEYLPHHTEGDVLKGGDEYKEFGVLRQYNSKLRLKMDRNRIKIDKRRKRGESITFYKIYQKILGIPYTISATFDEFFNRIGNKTFAQQAREGAWYGNDTLWRTVLDLNYCLMYTDHKGQLHSGKQRTIIHLGDMIVSGQGEGPLAPLAKDQHMLLFSENAVEFDCILTKIMGFD